MTTPRSDLARQISVTLSALVCVIGGAWGSGALGGTPVAEAADGALSAEATLIAPAGPAFSIWSIIYLGLIAYAVWQWLPEQRTAARHRAAGGWIAASMLLNTAWLATVQAGWVSFSVVVILALAFVLGVTVRALLTESPSGVADRVITDVTVGLYLGWVTVATCANAAAALVDGGFTPSRTTAEWWTLAVLVVAAALAWLLVQRSGGNVAIAVAVAWGLAWVAVGRFDGPPASTFVGASAAVAAGVVALMGVLVAVGVLRPAGANAAG